MHIRGGPVTRDLRTPDGPLPGVVEVHHVGDSKLLMTVIVGRTGRFRFDLPVGNYELVGRPENTVHPIHSKSFAIDGRHTAHVDLESVAT